MFVDLYCFHIEALSSDEEIENLIKHIKEKNMKVGIAIKPKTPSSVLYPWISSIDMALVMVSLPLSSSSVPPSVPFLYHLSSSIPILSPQFLSLRSLSLPVYTPSPNLLLTFHTSHTDLVRPSNQVSGAKNASHPASPKSSICALAIPIWTSKSTAESDPAQSKVLLMQGAM